MFLAAVSALFLMTVLSALLGWVVTTFIPRYSVYKYSVYRYSVYRYIVYRYSVYRYSVYRYGVYSVHWVVNTPTT